MAIKVIAQLREVKIGKNPGKKFVMRPDLYVPIAEKKVFQEAATHSGISSGVIKAAWDAAGEVIRTWATEGHSIPLPGLGTMRFGVRSKAVEKLEDVKANLISVRRIIFTPNVDVKDELKNTSIQITCLDEDGNVLKRVTSGDSGDIEDNENGQILVTTVLPKTAQVVSGTEVHVAGIIPTPTDPEDDQPRKPLGAFSLRAAPSD